MKQCYKLSEHQNDKSTAFAGSLHSAAWLGALALLEASTSSTLKAETSSTLKAETSSTLKAETADSIASKFALAAQKMRSDIWFRQPVRSDFSVMSESVLQGPSPHHWQINNHIEDDEGLKVEAVHQSCDEYPQWATSPRILELQNLNPVATLELSTRQVSALRRTQQMLQTHFSIVSSLPPHDLIWCSLADVSRGEEPGLRLQLANTTEVKADVDRLRLQVLLGYLTGWSFIASLTGVLGTVDVLVSRVSAVVETVVVETAVVETAAMPAYLQSPIAVLAVPNSETFFLQQLQTRRRARAEVLVRSGEVLMKGLFHVRYV